MSSCRNMPCPSTKPSRRAASTKSRLTLHHDVAAKLRIKISTPKARVGRRDARGGAFEETPTQENRSEKLTVFSDGHRFSGSVR